MKISLPCSTKKCSSLSFSLFHSLFHLLVFKHFPVPSLSLSLSPLALSYIISSMLLLPLEGMKSLYACLSLSRPSSVLCSPLQAGDSIKWGIFRERMDPRPPSPPSPLTAQPLSSFFHTNLIHIEYFFARALVSHTMQMWVWVCERVRVCKRERERESVRVCMPGDLWKRAGSCLAMPGQRRSREPTQSTNGSFCSTTTSATDDDVVNHSVQLSRSTQANIAFA